MLESRVLFGQRPIAAVPPIRLVSGHCVRVLLLARQVLTFNPAFKSAEHKRPLDDVLILIVFILEDLLLVWERRCNGRDFVGHVLPSRGVID